VTLQKQVLIWALSLGVLVVALWTFSPILLPFIAGLVLAYFSIPWRTRCSVSVFRGWRQHC
jgi:predicted PurR-regulated permease PerM